MTDLGQALTERGYKVFENKLFPEPIIALNTEFLDTAEQCDVEQILNAVIKFCKTKIKESEKQ